MSDGSIAMVADTKKESSRSAATAAVVVAAAVVVVVVVVVVVIIVAEVTIVHSHIDVIGVAAVLRVQLELSLVELQPHEHIHRNSNRQGFNRSAEMLAA